MSDLKYREGHRKRLRDRFLNGDVADIPDYEVLEFILTYAIPRKDVKPLAKELINTFGSFRNVLNASAHELCRVSGIGQNSALLISMFKPVCLLYMREKLEETPFIGCKEEDFIDFLMMKFDRLVGEHMFIMFFDASGRMIASQIYSGGLNSAVIQVRDFVSLALANKASSVIFAHNHPHGKLQFSESDICQTHRLAQALGVFDIELYDHILISGNKYISWRDDNN